MFVRHRMDGYAKVARLMSRHTEMACIRGFKSLSFQNLLYLQAELVELETEYGDIAVKDRRSQHPRKALYEKNWYMLSQSQQDGNDEQWKKFLEIRAKLKEYCKIFNLVPNRVQNCRLNQVHQMSPSGTTGL